MSRQSELAYAHQADIISLGKALATRTVALWQQGMNLADLDGSWQQVAPLMVRQVKAAQTIAAQHATPYLNALDQSYPDFTPALAAIIPATFANVMGDGREVAPALFGAVTNTKSLIGTGVEPIRAFERAASFLALIAQSAVHDASRNASGVLAAGKTYTRYVRVVNGSACSRCAILAGTASGPEAFKRHVSCQCDTAPIPGPLGSAKVPDGFHATPGDYFDSLSKVEQDRVFTNAGAEAIRHGADPISVVNARRGAYGIGYSGHTNVPVPADIRNQLQKLTIGVKADGSPLQVYATTESTTARGAYGKSLTKTSTLRLMPEQIAVMAGHDGERWVELLKKYGYLY